MLYCYHKPLNKMNLKELTMITAALNIKDQMTKQDILESIRQVNNRNLLKKLSHSQIISVCVQHHLDKIYTEIVSNFDDHQNILFEKVNNDDIECYSYSYKGGNIDLTYLFDQINNFDIWFFKTNNDNTYTICSQEAGRSFSQLRKIHLFLHLREQHIKLKLLNIMDDVVRYIGFMFIDYYQLYNIILK